MKRRQFLKSAAGISSVTIAQANGAFAKSDDTTAREKQPAKAIFIPGYWPQSAYSQGEEALYHPDMSRGVPVDYDGPTRLLTRLGLDGDIVQAIFPVHGHDIKISPDEKTGFFCSLENDSYVSFDPETLDVISIGKPWKQDWIGGGHAMFVNDGDQLAITERAPKVGYSGTPSEHFGRITLRDPCTQEVFESYSTHGISPHDVRLLADGKHLAVANYGTTIGPGEKNYGLPRHVVEPSITIIELASGKLVEKYLTGSTTRELRHLCAVDFDMIIANQAELDSSLREPLFREHDEVAYEADRSMHRSANHFPAPTLKLEKVGGGLKTLGNESLEKKMRHGLSIHYEPVHNEIISTYRASHMVIVYDATTGDVKHQYDTSKIGLDYPSGLTMLPDPGYYAVAGYWKNLYIFERGTHKLMRELCHYATFFGHSHIAAI